ncbi:MAG TPA: beta-N-acetylhexosaminidase [Alphaproteobacteria bacterium]
MSTAARRPKAVIYGCAGPVLTDTERAFFARVNPLGFILFARNVRTPAQVRELVGALRESVGRADAPVLIDQEGGRVARLRPPYWRAAPSAATIGALADTDLERAREAAWLNARLIGAELGELGITVDCAPVADVPVAGSHDVIGDRAYGTDPARVSVLARAAALGFIDAGLTPVIKHIPGHGRARVDSHAELPVVDTPRDILARTDFVPFRALADMPWAMTAHVLYTALDPDRPATTSPTIIRDIIRGEIGFTGVLVSDDLSMQALKGTLAERAGAALDAGCDIALHCNGDMDEMVQIAGIVPPLADDAAERLARAEANRRASFKDSEPAKLAARLDVLLSGGAIG